MRNRALGIPLLMLAHLAAADVTEESLRWADEQYENIKSSIPTDGSVRPKSGGKGSPAPAPNSSVSGNSQGHGDSHASGEAIAPNLPKLFSPNGQSIAPLGGGLSLGDTSLPDMNAGPGTRSGEEPFPGSGAEVQVVINPDRCKPALVWINGLICEANTNGYAHQTRSSDNGCQINDKVNGVGDSFPSGTYRATIGNSKPEWGHNVAFELKAVDGMAKTIASASPPTRNMGDIMWHSRPYMLDGKFAGEGKTAGCLVSAPACLDKAKLLYPNGFTLKADFKSNF